MLTREDFEKIETQAKTEVPDGDIFPGATKNMLIVVAVKRHLGIPVIEDNDDDV